jgi:tetratricopeptide (TPR) repeat protein
VRQDLLELFGIEHCFARSADPGVLARTVRLLLEGRPAPSELAPLSPTAEAVWTSAMEAFRSGSLDAAIAQLQAGIESEPDAFELHYHLGLLYGRRESAFAAIGALERAVALQPRHFSALKNLAVVYQRAGLRNTCIDVWQQAMSAAPDDDTRATIREHLLSLL